MSDARARNVVLISLDTLRYDCVGACPEKPHLAAYGLQEELETPNLDRFFAEGLYFTECRSPAPLTTPAHASLMTGLYPAHHGARALFKWAVAQKVGTLAEELKDRGYATVAVTEDGETNWLRAGSGVTRGFEAFFRDELPACEHCAALEEPVLLFIHTWDIHMPYCWSAVEAVRTAGEPRRRAALADICSLTGMEPPAGDTWPDQEEFWRQAWHAARRQMDQREVARLFLQWYIRGVNLFDSARWPRMLAALERGGLTDALIVAFSDHGEALLPDGDYQPMWHTGTLLEDALRVPLAIRAPALAPERVDEPASLLDVAPTVMDYLGLTPRRLGRRGETDGRSLLEPRRAPPACYFAEAWDKDWQLSPPARTEGAAQPAQAGGNDAALAVSAPPYEAPGPEERLREVWTPVQACVRSGRTKLLWHPARPSLARFRPGGAAGVDLAARTEPPGRRIRAFLRARLPGPLVRAIRWALYCLRRGLLQGKVSKGPGLYEWRAAPLFLIDLAEDTLEERPLPVQEDTLSSPQRELLDHLREHWRGGILGDPIELEAEEQEQVLKRLRELGYAD